MTQSSYEIYSQGSNAIPGLVSIAISPGNLVVPIGEAEALYAVGTFTDGSTEVLRSIRWSSYDPQIVSVNNGAEGGGFTYGIGAGSTTIVASAGTITAAVLATVAVPAPSISSFVPSAGPVGSWVVISGDNFGQVPAMSSVTFSGVPAVSTSWSPNRILTLVPGGASSGAIVVTVGGLSSNPVNFTVGTPPIINYLLPAFGSAGDVLTVSGMYFGGNQGASMITLNGSPASPAVWSDTNITVPIPVGATSGPVMVSVNGVASNVANFTVGVGPTVSYLLPSRAPIAATITIVGSHFGAIQGNSTVMFHGMPAVATSWSDRRIVVSVPQGARSGEVLVTVNGGVSNSGIIFIVHSVPAMCVAPQ